MVDDFGCRVTHFAVKAKDIFWSLRRKYLIWHLQLQGLSVYYDDKIPTRRRQRRNTSSWKLHDYLTWFILLASSQSGTETNRHLRNPTTAIRKSTWCPLKTKFANLCSPLFLWFVNFLAEDKKDIILVWKHRMENRPLKFKTIFPPLHLYIGLGNVSMHTIEDRCTLCF